MPDETQVSKSAIALSTAAFALNGAWVNLVGYGPAQIVEVNLFAPVTINRLAFLIACMATGIIFVFAPRLLNRRASSLIGISGLLCVTGTVLHFLPLVFSFESIAFFIIITPPPAAISVVSMSVGLYSRMLSPFLILFCLQRLPFPPVRLYGFFTILTYLFAILWSLFLEEAGINIRLLGLATAYFLILLLMINNPKAQEVPSIPMAPSPSETTDAIQSLQTLSVHRLGKRAGLTTREGEILALLLQGRSTPYIAEVLFISKGTVKTHARHIYAKLQVHTKQELLDLAAIARKEN